MFVPLLAVPLAVQMIAAAEGVPKLDVTAELQGRGGGRLHRDDARSGCRAASTASIAPATSSTRTGRASRPADRRSASRRSKGFEPTYTELATCLEMKRDLANPKPARQPAPANGDGAAAPAARPQPLSPGSIP